MGGCGGTGVSGRAQEALERYYITHSLIISISLPFFLLFTQYVQYVLLGAHKHRFAAPRSVRTAMS